MEENIEKKGRGRVLPIIIISILIVLLAVSLYYLFQEKEVVVNLTEEKAALQEELEDVIAHYDALIADKDSTNQELIQEREQLIGMIDSIKLLRSNDLRRLDRYRSEVYRLKRDKKKLLAKADSLILVTERLEKEKMEVESQLVEEQTKTQSLSTEKKRLEREVTVGSILQAQSITAKAVKIRRSGKERDTKRARSADKVKTCLTIVKNLIAPKGERIVYVRVTTPENTVIAYDVQEEESNEFDFNGEKLLYSDKKEVTYENEAIDMCIYVSKKEDFTKGTYRVEVYTDGILLGETSFVLR